MRTRNLTELLVDDAAAAWGELPALRWDGGAWSYRDLAARVGAAAGWLAARGVRRGDRVLLAAADSPEWIALFLGTVRLGAACGLAPTTLGADRLADLARRLGPRLVVAAGPGPDAAGAEVVAPADAAEGIRAALPDPGPAPVGREDLCYLLTTSGSTGAPKWVMHGHGAIPACIATYGRRVLRLGPGDVTWSTAALPSSYGLGNCCYFPLGAGAAAWIETAPRSPAAAARACEAGGVTALFGVPTGWARLARHVAEGRVLRAAFARVRLAVSAGEALDPRVWRAVEGAVGLRLVNALGASETTNLYLSDLPGAPRWGTVGHPVPGYEVRLGPHPSAPEGAGELLVRGPTLTMGYLGDQAATAGILRDGVLHTGDLARRRPDGGYEFLGRAGDRFKVGALWVDPAAVRAAILADADVADAVVLAVPDPAGVPRLAAAVAPRPGRAAGLAARVRGRLASGLPAHEVPRVIVVERELPVTGSGKADRTAVAARAAAALSAGGDQEVA